MGAANRIFPLRFGLVGVFVAAVLLCASAQAQVTWDSNTGTTGPQDGSGTWSTSDANWWNGSTDVVWPNLTTSSAIIGANSGAAGTITVSGSLGLNAITFNAPGSGNYTITGGTLGFGGSSPTITANAAATIGSAIASGAGLTKSGTGTLTLSGIVSNTSGNMSISRGTVTLTGTLTNTAGSTFSVGSSNGGLLSIAGGTMSTSHNNARSIVIAGGASQSGTIAISSGGLSTPGMLISEDSGGNGVFTQSGGTVTVGNQHLWLTGNSSTLAVSGGSFTNSNSTYFAVGSTSPSTSSISVSGSGAITLGTLQYGLSGRNGFTTTVNVGDGNGGGTLQVNGVVWSGATTVASTINFNSGTFVAGGSYSIPSQVSTVVKSGGANLSVAASQTLTISNTLADGGGGGGLTKLGAGTLSLTGANTYTGTTRIAAGNLSLGNIAALQTSTLDMNAADSGALVFGVSGTNTYAFGGLVGSRNVATSSTVSLAVGGNNSSGTYSGVLSGAGALSKAGSGILAVTGSNTYAGTTSVNAGTLQIGGGGTTGALSTSSVITGSAGATLAFNRTDTVTQGSQFNSVISGAMNVSQLGSGTVVFNGANTYTGTTSINAGTLQIGAGGAAGSLSTSSVITGSAGATLAFNRSDTVTQGGQFASVIGGGINVSKLGSGVLVLSGTQTYTGTTSVVAGTLQVTSGSLASTAVTVAGGATLSGAASLNATTVANLGILSPGAGGVGTLSLSSLTFSGSGTINVGVQSNTISSLLAVNGNVTTSGGTGSVAFVFGSGLANVTTGTYALVAYTGSQFSDVSAFTYTGSAGARQGVALANGTQAVNLVISNAFPIWSGTDGTGWSTANNWVLSSDNSPTSFIANDAVVFGDSASTGAVTLSANVNPVSTTFSGTTLAYTLSSPGGFGITSGALVKTGPAALTISTSNSFSGGTTLSAGTLGVGNGAALGTGTVALNGGTLSSDSATARSLSNAIAVGGNVTLGDAVNSGTLTLTGGVDLGGATRQVTTPSNVTLSGAVANGGLAKVGAGVLTLSGSNSHSNGTTLSAGQLNINNANALGSGAFTIASGTIDNGLGSSLTLATNNTQAWNGDFAFAGSSPLNLGTGAVTLGGPRSVTVTSSTLTVGGAVGGAFGLTKTGAGVLALSGSNTLGGGVTLSAGQLNVNNAGALGTGTFTISGGTIDNGSGSSFTLATSNAQAWNGDFTFAGSNALNLGTGTVTLGGSRLVTVASSTLTVGGGIGDGGNTYRLTKAGAGTLALSGSNTFGGGVTLSAGRLTINNANAIGTGTLTISSGTIDNGSGGTLTVAANNAQAWNGDFTVANSSNLNLGIGAVTLGTNAAVTVSVNTLTVGGGIGGAFGFTKAGAGTVILSGSSTFSGGLTLVGGQVQVANANALGTGTFTTNVDTNTTIAFNLPTSGTVANNIAINKPGSNRNYSFQHNQNNNLTFAGNINVTSGNGNSFTLSGVSSGTFTLTGSNAFGADVFSSAGVTFRIGGSNAAGGQVWRPDPTTNMILLDGANFKSVIGNAIASYGMEASGTASVTNAVFNRNTANVAVSAPANALLTFAGSIYAEGGNTTGTFTKTGAGTWAITSSNNTAMTYNVLAGSLQVSNYTALGGSSGASWVVLDGGTLRYVGGATSTAKQFTLGANGGGLDASGSGAVNFTSGSAVAFTGSGNRTLTLTGTNTGNNTLAALIADNGADKVSLTKSGAGTWVISGVNSYTGATTISAGTLITGIANAISGSSAITIGSAGSRGALEIDHALTVSSLTFTGLGGDISSASTGTATFSAASGTATITVLGGTNAFHANATLSSPTLVDVADGALFSFHNNLSGGASLTKSGAGTMELVGDNDTLSSSLFITAGRVNVGAGMNQIGSGTTTLSGGSIIDLGGQSFADRIVVLNGTILNAGGTSNTTTIAGPATVSGTTTLLGTYNITSTGSARFESVVGNGSSIMNVNVNSGAGSGGQAFFASAVSGATNITVYAGGTATFNDTVSGYVISHGASTFNSSLLSEVQVQGAGSALFAGATGTASTVAIAAGGSAEFRGTVGGIAIVTGSALFTSASGLTGSLTTNVGGLATLDNLGSTISGGIHNDGTLTVNRSSGSQTISGLIQGTGSIVKQGAGLLALTGENTFTGATTISAGTLSVGNGGTSGSLAGNVVNNAAILFNRSNDSTFAGNISGSGGLTKLGASGLSLSGSHSYSGATTVQAGRLAVNGQLTGTTGVTVQSGGELGGSGLIAGTIGGDGLIGPGNSPGILTVLGQVMPTSTTAFAFEFTATGSPTWSDATASVNDVLRLTNATPFASPLGGGNVVNIYFDVTSLTSNDTFLGGFYSDQPAGSLDFTAAIGSPSYQFFVKGDGAGAFDYNGTNYYTLGQYASSFASGITGVTASVVTVSSANFSGGTISNGQVTQFVIVPEPGAIALAGIGVAMAGWAVARSRRRAS